MKNLFLLLSICCSLISFNAFALEEITGKIQYLEATYLPSSIRFTMDGESSSCTAGKPLTYGKSNQENNMAVYSTLLAAFMGNQTVRVYVKDEDTNCAGQFVHLIK